MSEGGASVTPHGSHSRLLSTRIKDLNAAINYLPCDSFRANTLNDGGLLFHHSDGHEVGPVDGYYEKKMVWSLRV